MEHGFNTLLTFNLTFNISILKLYKIRIHLFLIRVLDYLD